MASGTCSNCGAQLPVPESGRPFLKCHFCGQVVALPREPPRPPPERPREVVRVVRPRRASGSPITSLLIVVAVLLVAGGTSLRRALRAAVSARAISLGLPSRAAAEIVQWDSQYVPYPAKIDDDAVEDFVGVYRTYERTDSGSTMRRFIGGFDGATFARVWTAGPFGDDDDSRGFAFAVAGAHVAVSDSHAVVHVLDATNGHETARVTLSDRAKSICTAPARSEVFVEVSDEQNVVVDLNSGSAKRAARPSYCRPERYAIEDIRCHVGLFEVTGATCKGVDSSFKAASTTSARTAC